MITALANHDVGRYVVSTASGSEYLLDLDSRTLRRNPATVPPLLDYAGGMFAQLRRDGEELELLMLEKLAIGLRARLWVQVRTDHITTLRTTTPVTQIASLDVAD